MFMHMTVELLFLVLNRVDGNNKGFFHPNFIKIVRADENENRFLKNPSRASIAAILICL